MMKAGIINGACIFIHGYRDSLVYIKVNKITI